MLETKEDTLEEDVKTSDTAVFTCPNCKKIHQDDVIFLCNTCKQEDLIFKEGLYLCPNCLSVGENFECMICGSKEVKMSFKKTKSVRGNSSK